MDADFGSAVSAGRASLAPERAFLGISALLFVVCAGGTILWSRSMVTGMQSSGDASMSMASATAPEPTEFNGVAPFIGMWLLMMVAMMLPSLVPALVSYRRAARKPDQSGLGGLTALAGVGYFFVWTVFGLAAYVIGLAVAAIEMQWPGLVSLVPLATGVVMLLVGGFQLTAWKGHQLGCCRDTHMLIQSLSLDARGAWRYGLRLGVHCSLCCAGFMILLLVTGMMDLGIMAVVAAAITIERLAPRPALVARALGIVIIAVGILQIVRVLAMV